MERERQAPVFSESTGARWQRLRRIALILGVATSILLVGLATAILIPPAAPTFAWRGVATRRPAHLGELNGTRAARARAAARERLYEALRTRPSVPSRRPGELALRPAALPQQVGAQATSATSATSATPAVTVGFYVSWDDNSLVSLRTHISDLDWVVGEWAFVAPAGDSVVIRVDRRALYVMQQAPAAQRPRAFMMLSNVDTSGKIFAQTSALRLIRAPVRDRAIDALATAAATYGLAGIVIDLESVPRSGEASLLDFLTALRTRLARDGRIVVVTVAADAAPASLTALAAHTDRVILMSYDEHASGDDAGPVASRAWFAAQVARASAAIPPSSLIVGIGGYGYDWTDDTPREPAEDLTFQEAVTYARENRAPIRFDTVSRNPYIMWSDPDSTDHVAWFLDAATAYDQTVIARAHGAAGVALWRLGSEDPSLWRVLGRGAALGPASKVDTIPGGYDVQFDGDGEILRVATAPLSGLRQIAIDSTTRAMTSERYIALPAPFIVQRSGAVPHRIALTFDDGPDPTWTPAILDTLRSRHALATFFVIGQNAEAHLSLLRQEPFAEGHEIGNHTFTHPNLALTSRFVTRLEIDATERLIEAALDRRSAFFRPPYFGDAEPTTSDELVPVSIASELGFLTAGLHVDSDDWRRPGTERVLRNVIDRSALGDVVLLHDGGGDRSQTLAALGPMIDSLRARGDTLVILSALVGATREQAMPPLPTSGVAARTFELVAFGTLGAVEWLLRWFFIIAITLGVARLLVMTTMAYIQRFMARHRARVVSREATAPYMPSVSVVVPAFNEGKVVVATVRSLLASEYDGPLEIVVVDDGSTDDTLAIAKAEFANEPSVAVLTKKNGGKASALNDGIAHAKGEIVVGLDADTVFRPDTIERLVQPLADERVGAVAGNAKVGNRISLVTRLQALEYITSQNLDRRAFALVDCITVVPGAVGAWRKSAVEAVGGFGSDTLAEDQDLTIRLHRAGWSVAYVDEAVAYTEAPDTLRGLSKQRFRWSFGTLQCVWKHRAVLFRRGGKGSGGTLGWFAFPCVWLFQLIFPALSPAADLLFVWSLVSFWLVKVQHGTTYAVTNLRTLMTLYAIFLLVDWVGSMLAFLLERGEQKELTLLVALQRFVYRQVMYGVVIRAFVAAAHGGLVKWGKLERKATVVAQSA